MIVKPYPVVAILDEDGDDRLLLKEAFEQCRQDIEIHSFGSSEDLLDYLIRDGRHGGWAGAADLVILGLHLPWRAPSISWQPLNRIPISGTYPLLCWLARYPIP